jgi:hypothetical protein
MAAEGVSVELGDAGPDAPLHRGGHAVLGAPPLPSHVVRARGRERLGSIHRVIVSLEEPAAKTAAAHGELQVTVNRCVSRFSEHALRHGDTVEIAAQQGAVQCVLRIVEEGAPMPPPRLVDRDGLAIWEGSILGNAYGVRRELVLDRSGRVALVQHSDGAHPEDATVLREVNLARKQVVAFADLVAWARPDDLMPREWGATRAATVVFYGDRIQAVDLSDREIQGDRDPCADVVLEWMLSLSRARGDEVARWRPPPLPDRVRRPEHGGAKLLTYTHWLAGDALRDHGERFTVYEGGDVIHGEMRLDERGREVPHGQWESRLSRHQLEKVEHALDSGLLGGDTSWSNPEHVSSTYKSMSMIDRYEGTRTIRTTTAGHAGGSVADLMSDMAGIARFLARKR